jgi:hypothetical protein
MNIATIQKRKFLNNIYKLYYSSGSRPSEQSVRSIFNSYFSRYKFGQPLPVDYNEINFSEVVDAMMLNELMINSIFNMEVLYDCINENNYELMSTITSLNNKLSNLKLKRRELEGKVDQLLFANNNTDGFFYSFVENFSSTKNIDLNLTSSYIDTQMGNASIPKISSGVFDMISSSILNISSAKFSVVENGTTAVENSQITNFDNALDGLTDTYWSYTHTTSSPSIVSIQISIPVASNATVSKIEGIILTSSPCGVILEATPSDINLPIQTKFKNAREDYDRFSFVLNPLTYSSIRLTLFKTLADEVSNNSSRPYSYSFGLRDLFIGAKYHDKRSTIVSQPITIPTKDNKLLSIESVSLEVDHQVGSGYEVNYFVAADTPGASGIEGFNWIAIDPTNANNNVNPTIVNIQSTNRISKLIYDQASIVGGLELIDLNTTSQNINDLNPSTSIYSGKTVYKICNVGEDVINQPFILNGLNSFKNYAIVRSSSINTVEIYKSLNVWAESVSGVTSSDVLVSSTIENQLGSISPGLNGICSGLLDGKIICDRDISVIHTVSKSRSDFNLGIYLNETLIADIPSGINYIKITYDKNFEGLVSFNIMSGKNISDYGTLFINYFSYLDPYEFRQRVSDNSFVFTIDNVFGSRYVISSKYLEGRSQIKYFSEISNPITAVRYRADLYRGNNPLVSPSIDSIRVKFKHNEEG